MPKLRSLAIAIAAFTSLTLPHLAAGQDILPPLDLPDPTSRAADFVPGEIIVKLKEAPAVPDSAADIEEVEAVAFTDSIRPLGGGEFLMKLDLDLFTAQSMETLANRTAKVAAKLEQREDIASARADSPGVVEFRPVDAAEFEAAAAAGEFENLAFEGEPRELSNGRYALSLDLDLVSPSFGNTLRQRTLEALEELRERPDVEYAEPNYIVEPYQLPPPNDAAFPGQWNLFNNGTGAQNSAGGINLLRQWVVGTGSESIIVAVIDTGILPDHPEIVGSSNMVPGYDMITSDRTSGDADPGRDPNPLDDGDGVPAGFCGGGKPLLATASTWHGTHVAGIIGVGGTNNAIGIAGVNWRVRVQPIRALGRCGGDLKDVRAAIRYAAGLPVKTGLPAPNDELINPTPAHIINLSLGVRGVAPCTQATQAAIDEAVAKGITVIAAAGNDAIDVSQTTPAGCRNVIAVAASDARGHLAERYSNFGQRIDIMAPGGEVRRDDNGDGVADGVLSLVKGGYQQMNGTSMAAPHVSGVAALMLARDGSLTPAQILDRLKGNAIPRTAQDCPKPCGVGLLNAFFPPMVAPAAEAPAAAPASNPEP